MAFDPSKFETVHQVGGIRTGRYDWPDAGGSPGCRVALVDSGAGLRFTVAIDRGGDIVEASYRNSSLAYLTPNGYKLPSHAYHHDQDWLNSWPGGLVTSCGPRYMGPPREEDGEQLYLHGPFSNTAAALLAIHNPDPRSGDLAMYLDMTIRDTRFYGPVVEVRRRIGCTLGSPAVRIQDEVINLGNTRVAHNWLYHVNFGYPLLDRDAQLIYRGEVMGVWDSLNPPVRPDLNAELNPLKKVPDNMPEHAGTSSRGLVLDVTGDAQDMAHIGLLNRSLGFAVELNYSTESLPRMANWQHFGPGGAYVSALEPFSGSLFGKPQDPHPLAAQWLDAGQSKKYEMNVIVHPDEAAINGLLAHDGDLVPIHL